MQYSPYKHFLWLTWAVRRFVERWRCQRPGFIDWSLSLSPSVFLPLIQETRIRTEEASAQRSLSLSNTHTLSLFQIFWDWSFCLVSDTAKKEFKDIFLRVFSSVRHLIFLREPWGVLTQRPVELQRGHTGPPRRERRTKWLKGKCKMEQWRPMEVQWRVETE